MLNFAAGNNFRAGNAWSDLMKDVEMAEWKRLRESSALSPSAKQRLLSSKALCTQGTCNAVSQCFVFFFFSPQLNMKNAVSEQTQHVSISPGDKGDHHAASCLGQVGRCL